MVEWATGRTFKRGEAARMAESTAREAVGGRSTPRPSPAQKVAEEDRESNILY